MPPEGSNGGTPLVQFRSGELLEGLRERSTAGESVGQVAQRDLERYYALLARELPAFPEQEASLIMNACNGWYVESHSVQFLWAQVADSLEDGYAEKWGVNGPALVARLRGLTYTQALATVDAVERALRSGLPTGEALRRVRLVRDEPQRS